MRFRFAYLTAASALGLSACQSLPVDFPGRGDDARPGSAAQRSTTPPAPLEAPEQDSRNGVAGAALCASAAYYLADKGAMDAASASALGDVWVTILEVIPAKSADERQTAIDNAYAAFETMDRRGKSQGLEMAAATMDSSGCTDPDFQRRYLARWGDPDLMEAMMQDSE